MSPSSPSTAESLEPETFELDEEELAAIEAAELSLDRGEGLDATEFLASLRAAR
jgi:hypothetical protein